MTAISPFDKPDAAELGMKAARLILKEMRGEADVIAIWDHRLGAYKLIIRQRTAAPST